MPICHHGYLPFVWCRMMRKGSAARSSVWTVCTLGLVLSLAGCKVGPDFTKPEAPVAPSWGPKGDPRVSTQAATDIAWWKTFNDPALDRLVELAYRQNLPLQIAGLKIMQARAEFGIATGKQFPQQQELFASASAVGLGEHDANVVTFDRHYFTYVVGFDAMWELDFWGKYGRGVESQAANLLASVADYDSALVSLTAEVARTYATIRTYEVLTDLAQENARIQADGLSIAESRLRNGATSELDVTQATSLLESTRATIPRFQVGVLQGRTALSTLLGQTPGTVDALLTGPKEIPKAPAKVAVSVPAEMLRRRPDIRSAELYAAAQCARIGVAKAELYPSFSLFGTIGFRTTSGATGTPSSYSFGNSLFYVAGPRVNWPFFNYGRLQNGVRVEDARFQQLLVGYRNTVLKAAQEVEDALAGFLSAEDAIAFEQNSVRASQRSVELSVTQYREGAVDFQRVLDAQRSLLQEQNNLAQLRSAAATNLIALYKALGGGWESRLGQPYVPERTQMEMKERTNWGDMLSQPRSPETKNPPPGKR
jgi:NodT family efflux transporter outer membrane factor (OMF) lipoprotein